MEPADKKFSRYFACCYAPRNCAPFVAKSVSLVPLEVDEDEKLGLAWNSSVLRLRHCHRGFILVFNIGTSDAYWIA